MKRFWLYSSLPSVPRTVPGTYLIQLFEFKSVPGIYLNEILLKYFPEEIFKLNIS